MVDSKEIIGTIFALFIGIAMFMSYEPTRLIIENLIGTVITAVFTGIVILIVIGVIFLVVKLREGNII